MTSLKYKDTDGTWKVIPIVGPPGAGVPAGGAAGDILVKQSATDRDTGWRAPATQPWVLKAGDTMTGLLTITPSTATDIALILNTGFGAGSSEGAQMRWGGAPGKSNFDIDNFNGDFRLLMPGAPGGVGFSVSAAGLGTFSGGAQINGGNVSTPNCFISTGGGESFRLYSAGYMSFYNGGTRVGYFQANGNQIFLNAEISGSTIRIRGNNGVYLDNGVNNYQLSENAIGTRVVATGGAGYIYGNYFNMTANDVAGWPTRYAGMESGDNFLRWYQQVHSSHIRGGDMNIAGQIQSGKVAGAWYYDQAFFDNPGNTMAGYGFHPGGTAGSLRFQTNQTRFYFNSLDSNGFYDCLANSFIPTCSIEFKSGVIDLPETRPVDVVRQLRPRWYQTPTDLDEPMEIRDTDGTLLEVRKLIHDCDTSPHCTGTRADPCNRMRAFRQGRVGLVAEELAEVFPVIVVRDADHRVQGYDLVGLVTLLVGAIRNLNDDLNALREAA